MLQLFAAHMLRLLGPCCKAFKRAVVLHAQHTVLFESLCFVGRNTYIQ